MKTATQAWTGVDQRRLADGLGMTVPEVLLLGQRRAEARLTYLQSELQRAAAREAQVRSMNAARGRS